MAVFRGCWRAKRSYSFGAKASWVLWVPPTCFIEDLFLASAEPCWGNTAHVCALPAASWLYHFCVQRWPDFQMPAPMSHGLGAFPRCWSPLCLQAVQLGTQESKSPLGTSSTMTVSGWWIDAPAPSHSGGADWRHALCDLPEASTGLSLSCSQGQRAR